MPGFDINMFPISNTPLVGPLVQGYLQDLPELKHLFTGPLSRKAIHEAAGKRIYPASMREKLATILEGQYQELASKGEDLHPAVLKNLSLLRSGTTFTITTGHQLQLAGGPLFFTYKILTAIKLANALNEDLTANHFIPVFWLASEDHDFPEIDHFQVNGTMYKWNSDFKGPVGHALCSGVLELIKTMEPQLDAMPFKDEVIRLLEACYREGDSLSLATRKLTNRLFGDAGLIVIDPDHAELKAEMTGIFRDELFNHPAQAAISASEKVISEFEEPQVHPRQINLFYLSEHGRNRIVKDDQGFAVLNTPLKFSAAEMESALNNTPGRFSPNVILRPVYQETILPNLAYVGGPSEIAYWLQFKPVFEHWNCSYPYLVIRNSFLVTDRQTSNKMDKLGVTGEMVFLPADEWVKKLIVGEDSSLQSFNAFESELREFYKPVAGLLGSVDPTLQASAEAEMQKAINGLENLKSKMARSLKRKNETVINQLSKLHEKIHPGGAFQERSESLWFWYALMGKEFLQLVLDSANPLGCEFVLLREKNETSS